MREREREFFYLSPLLILEFFVARRRVGEFCGDEMDAFVFCELYTIYFLHALKTQTQIHTHTHTHANL